MVVERSLVVVDAVLVVLLLLVPRSSSPPEVCLLAKPRTRRANEGSSLWMAWTALESEVKMPCRNLEHSLCRAWWIEEGSSLAMSWSRSKPADSSSCGSPAADTSSATVMRTEEEITRDTKKRTQNGRNMMRISIASNEGQQATKKKASE